MSTSPLERRRTPPEGAAFYHVATADGLALRAMWVATPRAQGTVAIVPGRTEFIERYFETAADLVDRGFAVAVLDMRNQGLSPRPLPDRYRHHLADFAPMVDDVHRFLTAARARGLPEPVHLLAHSMGAHVVLRYLHDRPGVVASAVLSAPMVAIRFGSLPHGLLRPLAAAACRAGCAEHYAAGQRGPRDVRARQRLMRLLTSDPERFADEAWHLARRPELALGGVTWGWLAAALRSSNLLAAPGYAEATATRTLVLFAGADRVVDNDAALAFARRMPVAEIVEIAGSRHEILRERDFYRRQFWDAFGRFLAQGASSSAQTSS